MNLATWVHRHAARIPDAPAIADSMDVHATWREFSATTRALAGGQTTDCRRFLQTGDDSFGVFAGLLKHWS